MLGLAEAASFALSLLREDRIPNEDAIALAPTIGWVMLACAVSVFVMFIVQSERWRRLWLTMEDPRPIALFRIVFAFLVICNVNDLWEYFEMLFTDEGIFFSDVARQVFAAGQFAGYGDGIGNDPKGFFDVHGLLLYLKGPKYSPLFFWDTPAQWWALWTIFHLITLAFMVGWKTRTMGVLSFVLMNGIFLRNQLFWEGTELVYRVFFFYLIVARSGQAWSVDNWLRCRKLRKQGLLSERGGPGNGAGVAPSEAHPKGLAAIYRLIPAWPRWLAVVNLGALYCYTGVVKNGAVWAKGDALYYALNMDHFYRFYPQQVAAVVGMSMFRLATWVTHWWEALFPVLVFGEIARWAMREQLPPLSPARLWVVRAMWLFFGVGAGTTAIIAMPVHYVPGMALKLSTAEFQVWFGIGWALLLGLLGGLWWWLGHNRVTVKIRGKGYKVDREWFCRWVLGRRTWLTLGLMFHGNLNVMMNIGMFPPVMMSTYFVYLHGDDPAKILRFFGKRMPRWVPLIPEGVRRGEPPLPAEDRALPHHFRDAQALPEWLMFALLAVALGGVLVAVAGSWHFGWTALGIGGTLVVFTYAQGHARSKMLVPRLLALLGGLAALGWLLSLNGERWTAIRAAVLIAVVGVFVLRKLAPAFDRALASLGVGWTATDAPAAATLPLTDPGKDHVRAPWAYGPGGRVLIGGMIVWHITAVAVWLMPDKDVLHWRNEAKSVFREWLIYTSTDQSWGMFAPNPPRHNVLMRAVVIDQNDEKWDMRTDVYAPERKPIPWIWNDRMRKMNRRIIGGESGKGDWYQKWYARYLCRMWQMAHGGEAPKKVELFKISYRIPSPEEVTRKGWYVPEDLLVKSGEERRQYTETCKTGITAQAPNEHFARHGIPLADEKDFKPWVKDRKKKWDTRHENRGIVKPSIEKTKRTIAKARAEARSARAVSANTGGNPGSVNKSGT
ncbi:MAG: hypothetical protein IPK80_09055 [Nannocystis sp.]|nr:hypothetical protein [Nannocystis sp.]